MIRVLLGQPPFGRKTDIRSFLNTPQSTAVQNPLLRGLPAPFRIVFIKTERPPTIFTNPSSFSVFYYILSFTMRAFFWVGMIKTVNLPLEYNKTLAFHPQVFATVILRGTFRERYRRK